MLLRNEQGACPAASTFFGHRPHEHPIEARGLKGRGATQTDSNSSCRCTALRRKPRPFLVRFARRIRLSRVEAGLTQTDLAQKTHAKQKSISRYETGASVPTIDTLLKVANVLKKTPGYFLGDLA